MARSNKKTLIEAKRTSSWYRFTSSRVGGLRFRLSGSGIRSLAVFSSVVAVRMAWDTEAGKRL